MGDGSKVALDTFIYIIFYIIYIASRTIRNRRPLAAGLNIAHIRCSSEKWFAVGRSLCLFTPQLICLTAYNLLRPVEIQGAIQKFQDFIKKTKNWFSYANILLAFEIVRTEYNDLHDQEDYRMTF